MRHGQTGGFARRGSGGHRGQCVHRHRRLRCRAPSSLIIAVRDKGSSELTIYCNGLGQPGFPTAHLLADSNQISYLVTCYSARPDVVSEAKLQIRAGQMSLELVPQGMLVEDAGRRGRPPGVLYAHRVSGPAWRPGKGNPPLRPQAVCAGAGHHHRLRLRPRAHGLQPRTFRRAHSRASSPATARTSARLEWSTPLSGIQQLAVELLDPGAPGGTFTHWLVYGISPGITNVG
jgi:hypothetical protein